MIDAPPSLAGALKVIEACALPAVAVPITGAPGTVGASAGVTELDGSDSPEVPSALVVVTVKV
ncbi:MAG: hypothetical protein V2J20_06320 [Wenzhouxiangella sp.]|nr:hypothetical protein [Wenzhouxiangella sp.]